MRMSASCPRNEARPRVARGFTLLELLVVLGLIAMMAALVAPRLQKTYQAIASSGERAETVRQLERLPLIARDQGRAIEIPEDGGAELSRYLVLPEGWSVRALEPVMVEASGLCHATRVRVEGAGTAETWTLGAPDCGVADVP